MKPHRKKHLSVSDSGFTIIELVAVLVLSTVVMAGTYITISTFLLKFQQLQRISILNREAFECMQVLKHGITVEVANSTHFMGIVNADEAELSGNYSSGGRSEIVLKPPSFHSLYSDNDYINIFLKDGYIGYKKNVYNSAYTPVKEQYIFPKNGNSRNQLIEVTNLIFSNADPYPDINPDTGESELKIIKVLLEARIEISRDKNNNSVWHNVNYETYMAIGKM